MSCHSFRVPHWMLGLLLILGAAPAMATTQPTLFTLASGTPKVLAQGAQKSWPIKISEDKAFDAVFQGGMWLPNPAGGRIYAKYQRHILHANGTWTWIGTVDTVHGPQSVVLTFGKGGMFGLVPQASGYPLRIVTRGGQTRLVETSAKRMRQAVESLRLYSKPDYRIPPRVTSAAPMHARADSAKASPVRADAGAVPIRADAGSAPTIIDVMVAYTPGFVTETGSVSLALTRIQNLVDITNNAYTTSGVNQQIRLVTTAEVNYPDNTSNDSALDDLTGLDTNGNSVPIPTSLQGIAALRVQYGADLVTLIRSYDNATQGSCGVGWLIGGGQTQIIPSQSKVYGYNVVSDGSNGGYYCLDTTFAHELGHNMGNDHDRAHASTAGGAYTYSYGYLGNGTNGFSTIMAYGTTTDTPLATFSNPNISSCQNTPCGVADTASNSADNAHSMNNTAALIAQFEPTMVGNPAPGPYVHNDVNGDGRSDLLWYNAATHQMTYWLMNGPTINSWSAFYVPAGYTPIATGDFNGDGLADILWTDASGNVYMWMNNGIGAFVSRFVTQAIPGWQIVGTVDLNNDGNTDLIWYNSSAGYMTYWLMNGPTLLSWQGFTINPGQKLLATGDFDGSGYGDLLWEAPSGDMYMWLYNASGTFSSADVGQYPTWWTFAGAEDVNGDGKTDLLWYNSYTGQMTYWLMNGATVAGWQGFSTNPSLTPLATGIFDGTNAGLTWKTPSGGLYMWLFNRSNPGSLSWYSLGSYPTWWVPLP